MLCGQVFNHKVMPKIALINANTTQAMTDKMFGHAQTMVPPGVAVEPHTAPRGNAYISTPEAAATAAEVVADMVKTISADVIVISCFGDPGLFAARKSLDVPVIGMADASCHVATQLGEKFAIVTGGRAWGPMLTEFVETIGLSSRCAGIHTLELTGDMIAADPFGAETLVLGAIEEATASGAEVVILGGAGLVGFAARLQPRARAILLDSLQCAITQACAMVPFSRPRQAPGS